MPSDGQPAHRPPAEELRIAAGLFAAVSGLVLLLPTAAPFWSVLYVLPVLVAARGRPLRTGALAAGLATALTVAWTQLRGVHLGAQYLVAHACAFAGGAWIASARYPSSSGVDPGAAAEPSDEAERQWREGRRLVGLATWELDLATGTMDWSDEYRALYGVDSDTFVSSRKAFQELVHVEDRELLDDAIERITEDGTTVEIRYRITRPGDGVERCIRTHISSRRDENGSPISIFGTGQDVTDLVMVLSPREREILMLLAEGHSGEDIAEQLFLSPATIRTHVQNAMAKLGAHTRGQAIATALRSEEIGS